MFIYSVRASTLKFFGGVILSLAALITLICFIPTASAEDTQTFSPGEKISYANIKTNDDRLNFLKQFGWEAEPSPSKEDKVTIPAEFDRVYVGYNDMQKSLGLDLSKYRNKEVLRYCYSITNYPDYEGEVTATLLIYRNKVIGGDISSADANGFSHSFAKPTS